MEQTKSTPIIKVILLCSVALIVTSLSVMIFTTPEPRSKRIATNSMDASVAAQGGMQLLDVSFKLTGSDRKQISSEDMKGKTMLIYFGFAHCPDVCPASLSEMAMALDTLKHLSHKVQPVFISLDPERDVPEKLKVYFDNFDKRFVALTGTKEQIKDVATRYKVYAAKTNDPSGKKDSYTMNHSAFYYLVDKNGKFIKYYAPGTKAKDIAQDLKRYI